MASRRCLTTLTRQTTSLLSSNHLLNNLPITHHLSPLPHSLSSTSTHNHHLSPLHNPRTFSSQSRNPSPPKFPTDENQIHDADDDDDDDEGDEEDYTSADEVEEEEIDGNVGKRNVLEPANLEERSYYVTEKLQEAVDIGYKVVGPLKPDDRVFKEYEPAFAIVQIGSHQFKVSNGDCIYVEKLKYCEVNDKLLLNKVLMVGSPTQTIIGRPILPEAAVHAIVEEHALDAKVIIFKKKRRKNYRRTKGHRQELTRLRITDIQGVEKQESPFLGKSAKSAKKTEKVAVAA